MKKLILFLVLLLFYQVLLAGSISRQVAQQKAETCQRSNGKVKLVFAAEGEDPAYYIFNNEKESGFVIVSGDDAVDALIGYSDTGAIDPQNMPPAMIELLEAVGQKISLVRQGKTTVRRASRRAAAITPMLTTSWGQRWPYNRMAPEYEEGQYCAAGCLAVAMAQLLKYWAPTSETKAIPGYQTEELGLVLEELPPRTFNYALMRDVYGMFDWDDSAREVAALIRYCGQAAQMDYDINSGAETSGSYLADYFGFQQSYTDKVYYTHMIDWEGLLYEELEAGRPMLYSGKKINGSGHVFVVDGYQDGYFHINWGWDGSSNGFFDISYANPDEPDGGSWLDKLRDGYQWLQMAVIGLQSSETSGIQSVVDVKEPIGNAPWYTLDGRCLRTMPMRKGLYVHLGRKIVVK